MGVIVSLLANVATAAVDPFYLDLYRRGMIEFQAGDFATAAQNLRLAAFGFVESLDQFETAHVYAAIASSKIGRTEDARRSIEHLVAAERVVRTYPHLVLPARTRAEFEVIAKTTLAANEYEFLTSNVPPPPRPTPQAVIRSGSIATPSPPTPQPAASQRPPARTPQPVTAKPVTPQPAMPQPAAAKPQPATPVPQPVTPAPKPIIPTPQPVTTPPKPVAAVVKPAANPTTGGTDGSPTSQPAGKRSQTEATTPPAPAPSIPSSSAPPRSASPPSAPAPGSSGSLTDAERALTSGDLARARAIYSAQLERPQLSHGDLLKIGEGLYRSRDFRGAVRAFTRAGAFTKGEEPYRYYLAVSLYESGQYAAAKRELAAALPFVEKTPDVERYRMKIEGAIE